MLKFHLNSPLCDQAGDGAAGGGAGAGAGAGGGSFDPAAFKLELKNELLADLRKDLNGIAKKLPGDIAKQLATDAKAAKDAADAEAARIAAEGGAGSGSGTGDGGGAGGGKDSKVLDPQLNAQLQLLSKQVTDLTKKAKESDDRAVAAEAEKAAEQRKSAIISAAGELSFKDPASSELFIKAFGQDIKVDEDGNYIAETEAGPLPLKDYFKAKAEANPAFLAPTGAGGGSGARPGKGKQNGWNPGDMSNLDPANWAALKPEQQAAVQAHIANTARQAQGG